jgi:hypothetical protein
MTANTPNRPVRIRKNANGSLTVWTAAGNEFEIAAEEKKLQAFVVFRMLQ